MCEHIHVTLDGDRFFVSYYGIVGWHDIPPNLTGHPDTWTPDESVAIEDEGETTGWIDEDGDVQFDEVVPDMFIDDVAKAVYEKWLNDDEGNGHAAK